MKLGELMEEGHVTEPHPRSKKLLRSFSKVDFD